MNTIYNVVWNSTTGTWVVASEMAKGRKKKPSTTSGAAAAAAAVGVGTMLLAGGAMAVGSRLPSGVIATKAYGGLVLCQSESDFSTVKGMSSGTLGSTGALCNGGPAIDYDMSFGLFNRSINQYGGGYGYDATASVTGFADGLLEVRGTQGISMLNTTLMNNNKITELAAGTVSSSSAEAINGSQLYALQTRVDNLSTSGDVKYFHTNTNLGDSVTTGEHSIAIGGNAASKGLWSVSIGTNSQATGSNSVAIGNSSVADRNTSVSVGNSGTQRQITYMAAGTQNTDAVNVSQLKGVTTALGGGAQVNTDGSVKAPSYVVGGNTYNNVGDAISAVSTSGGDNKYFKTIGGGEAQVSGNNSSAMGSGAAATIAYGTAVGSEAKVTGFEGTAVGFGSKVSGYIGTALGFASEANGSRTIAIGSQAIADANAEHGIAIGRQSHVTAKEAIALGAGSLADREYAVSVGNVGSAGVPEIKRQVVNMAAGTQNTDAVNVSQLKGVTTALGGGAQVNTDGSVKAPTYNVAGGSFNNVGNALAAMDAKSISGMKYFHTSSTLADSQANGVESLAIGGNAVATENAITIGANSKTSAYGDVVIGMDAKSITNGANNVGNGSTVVGYAASSTAMSGTAIGNGATANGISSSALGRLSKATGLYSVAVGSRNLAQADNSVALGSRSLADRANTVSVGAATPFVDAAGNPQVASTRQIVNMGKGVEDTDAVNVSQLKGVTAALGGGSVVSGDGTVTMPVYKVGDKDQIGVAAAIDALDKKPGGSSPNAVVYDGDDHLQITLAGKDGAATKITNVADGKLEAGSKDAVNGDQLYNVKKDLDVIAPKLKYLKFGQTDANEAQASGEHSVAIGGDAFASGKSALALGRNARSSADYSLAAGVDSVAGDVGAVALGNGTSAMGANSVALGANSVTNGGDINVLSLGDASVGLKRRITNVADGIAATDAATVGQVGKAITDAMGSSKSRLLVTPYNTSSVPVDKLIVAGPTTLADQIEATGKDAIAIGLNTHANADGAVAIGQKVTTVKKDSVGIGQNVNINGERSVVVGSNVSAIVSDAVVVGNGGSAVSALYGVAIGTNAAVKKDSDDSVAIGHEAKANAANTVVLGHGSNDDSRTNTVSVGSTVGADIKRQVINVAKGTQGTDAVNVDQLKGVTDALGGKAGVNGTNGTITAPDYVLDKGATTVHNVGDAITNIDGRITNVINGTAGLVQQAAAGANLTVGKATDGAAADFTGTAGARKLIGVADGTVATGSKEAVNGGQLFGTAQSVANALGGSSTAKTDGTVTAPAYVLDKGTTTAKSVGEAITNIDGRINNVAAGTLGLVQQAAAGANLTVGKDTDGAAVVFNSKAGTRQLKGVTAGVDDTDAVNVKQLTDKLSSLPSNPNAVSYDDAKHELLTLNPGGAPTKITNLAPGDISSKDSKDAVTGGQLFGAVNEIKTAVSDIAPKLKYIKFGTSDANEAQASGEHSVAIGGDAFASGKSALALGRNARSSADYSLSAGVDSAAGDVGAVALGNSASAMGVDSVALGARSATSGGDINVVSLGDSSIGLKRRITNVADGVGKTDAATVGQMDTAIAKAFNAKSSRMSVTPYNTSSVPVDKLIVAGPTTLADQIEATGQDSIAIGLNTHATADNAVAIGQKVTTVKKDSVGIGQNVNINGERSVVVGSNVSAIVSDAVVIGNGGSAVAAAYGVAIGTGAAVKKDGTDSVAIGHEAKANAANTVVLGHGSNDDSRTNTVSVGSTVGSDIKRQIINVANGTLDNDAVNVSQLKGVTDALGGKAGVNGTNGTITPPDYVVDNGKTTVHNVGDAITNIDGRVTNIVQGKAGLVQQANSGADLTVGKDTDGVGVNFAGTAGVRILRGVAPGKMDTDAVNISQLKDVASVISKDAAVGPDGKITMPEIKVGGDKYDDILAAINGVNGKIAGGSELGVAYDDSTKAKVTLNPGAGKAPVTIANVAAGVNDDEAVNVKQLKDAGIVGPGGEVLDAVVYDTGSNKGSVSFGGANGTVLKNVAAGLVSSDSKEAINGSQLYGASQSVAAIIGGGTSVDKDGKVVPAAGGIAVGKDKYDDLTKALNGLDGKIATGSPLGVAYDDDTKTKVTLNPGAGKGPVTIANVKAGAADDEAVNFKQLKDAGLVDTGTGKTLDAVVYDTGSNKATVTFGGANGTVLNNVADGRIGASSHEAINGGQIAAIKDALEGKITNIDNRVTRIENNGVGGGAPGYISANGLGGSPKPADAGNSPGVAMGFDSNASGDGASALGDHATAAGKDSVAIGNDAKATAAGANSVALGNGSIADRADTVSVGSAGHERTVSNVARGTADTDAVNVGLLNDRINAIGNSSNAYTDKVVNDVWSNLKEEIDHSNRQANRGIAAASALINVTPYVPGHTTVNAGVAGYRGESALGVGVSRWSENGRVNLNAGVSAAQGDEPVYRVGIGYIF